MFTGGFLLRISMKAGDFNSRIDVQYKAQVMDEAGATIFQWQSLMKLWANIRHSSGAEAIKADKMTSTVNASIRIRWRTDIKAGMRVMLKSGAVYEIQAVLPDCRSRRFVDLVCEMVG